MSRVFPQIIKERREWLILDTLHKGQSFGEEIAMNKIEAPYSVEVCSEKATMLKIHANQFYWYFGGQDGEPTL